MNNKMRLIIDPKRPGPINMGLDETILEEVVSGSELPTLRLYGWSPENVTIGYFQGMEEEVDLEACERLGVSYLRRTTGGGAVLNAQEVTYNLVAPVGFAGIPKQILDSYRYICGGVLAGLRHMGVEAEFIPLNDLVVNGKKISGNAQTRRGDYLLQHGTILLQVDVEKMFSLLKVPAEKLKGKLIADVKQRVTGLEILLGRAVTFDETIAGMVQGFGEHLQVEFERKPVTAVELQRAQELADEKYANRMWNFKR